MARHVLVDPSDGHLFRRQTDENEGIYCQLIFKTKDIFEYSGVRV